MVVMEQEENKKYQQSQKEKLYQYGNHQNIGDFEQDNIETASLPSDNSDFELSASTLSILQEYKKEQMLLEKEFEKVSLSAQRNFLKYKEKEFRDNRQARNLGIEVGSDQDSEEGVIADQDSNTDSERVEITMKLFKEDWNLSQFWYHDDTVQTFIYEVMSNTSPGDWIGCLASPTVFVGLYNLVNPDRFFFLFEIDERFKVFGHQFVHYDYNMTIHGMGMFHSKFDFLVIDPPFLATECFEKTAETAKYLLKNNGKVLVSTGTVMRKTVKKELKCRTTNYLPLHANGLSNAFSCFINYDSKELMFQEFSSDESEPEEL